MKNRKNIRLSGYNYSSNGFYFITNNTDFSRSYLKGDIKEIVINELRDLENRFAGLSIYYYSIMPTHIHVVINLYDCNKAIPEIWRVFKSKTTVIAKRDGFTGAKLWQRNYYEHVVRNEKALEKIVEYIRNNPFKEELPLDEIYGDRIPDLYVS